MEKPETLTLAHSALPIINDADSPCVGCAFTRVDVERSPALRSILFAEGCLEDCPILKEPTRPSSPVSPAHKSLS
jgi:hypothetical protein